MLLTRSGLGFGEWFFHNLNVICDGIFFLKLDEGWMLMEIWPSPHLCQEEGGASRDPLFERSFFGWSKWKSHGAIDDMWIVRCDQEKVDIDMDDMEGRIHEARNGLVDTIWADPWDPLVCNSHIKNSCIRSLPTFFDASAACSDTVHFFASNLVAEVFPFFPAGLWNVRQGQVLNELGKFLAGLFQMTSAAWILKCS